MNSLQMLLRRQDVCFPWQRYFADVSAEPFLDDYGFLVDPAEQGGYRNRNAALLSDFLGVRCVVVLGGPGIGKSTELAKAANDRCRDSAATDRVMRVNLANVASELDLAAEWLHTPEYLEWKSGTGSLELFFDSFDEGQFGLRLLANHFRRALKVLDDDQVSRLSLRFACRPVEWPESFQDTLIEVLGQDCFRAVRLLPLRRADAQIAVR